MNTSREIGVIEKNSTTRLIFSLTEYKGRTYLDIREHIATETYQGPTKKGLRLDVEFFEEFMNILRNMEKELKKGK